MKEYTCGDVKIPYEIIKSNRKSVSFSFTDQATLLIKAPRFMSDRDNERNGRRDTEGRGWKSTRKMGERGEKPSRRRNEERDLRRVKDVDRNGMPKKPHTSGKLRKGTPVKGKMSFTEYSKKHDL